MEDTEIKYCDKCGKGVDQNRMNFCPYCGEPVEGAKREGEPTKPSSSKQSEDKERGVKGWPYELYLRIYIDLHLFSRISMCFHSKLKMSSKVSTARYSEIRLFLVEEIQKI